MKLILTLMTLFITSPLFASVGESLTLENQLFNMTDKQWSNLEESIASNEMNSSFIEEKCFDAEVTTLHEKYAVSLDGQGQLCRVYDLTFPHLKLLFKGKNKKSVASVPTQKFKSSDFSNWVNGDYDKVYQSVASFQKENVNRKHKQVASWVKKLRFKKGSAPFANFANNSEMPQSFYASDINLGRKLKMSTLRKNQIKRIIASLAKSNPGSANYDQWSQLIDNPQNLLKKVRFDWNNVKKVYEIALEGQFLPINGPIALVNFDRPHKVFVEGILRRVVQIAVGQVLKRVAKGPTGLVVGYAINEAFVSIDMAYNYQMNRLEASFKDTLARGSLVMSAQDAKRGLNHVYLGQVDLVSEAILRMVQGQKFPWDQLEAMGRKQHFQTEKLRDVMMDSSNNFLVKKKDCATEGMFSYFALCKLPETDKLFSLITQFNVYGYNFGPIQTYSYEKPRTVLTRRALSYLLSTGLTIAKTPVPKWITSNLAKFLRQFAFAGIPEEAYLLSELSLKKSRVDLLPPEKPLLDMLYIQNLNVFTPKSIKHEDKIISANKKLLGIN